MLTLFLRPAPYVLASLAGLWIILGLSLLSTPPQDQPDPIEMTSLESRGSSDLPKWVITADAFALWNEAIASYLRRGDKETYQSVIVPLVSGKSLESWPNPSAKQQTAYLIEMPWKQFKSDHPEIAEAFTNDTGAMFETTLYPVSFEPASAKERYKQDDLIGTEIQRLLANGFTDVVLVRPNSKPATSEDAPGLIFLGSILGLFSLLWIRRRRRESRGNRGADASLEALTDAAWKGVSTGIREAISMEIRQV